jgi:ATP-dependent 26S proteasome regulatory subunit
MSDSSDKIIRLPTAALPPPPAEAAPPPPAATATTILPRWAELVREKYVAGEASTFILYRNVFDIYQVDNHFVDLVTLLRKHLVDSTKETIVEVSPELGVRPVKGSARITRGEEMLRQLHALEVHLYNKEQTAVLVPYADALMPASDGFSSSVERNIGICFHRMSLDRVLAARDNIIIMVTESLSSLDQALVNNPRVAAIEVPMPDLATRSEAIRILAPKLNERLRNTYAERMAGLRLVQIEGILTNYRGALSESEREALILKLLEGAPDAAERAKKFAGITAGMTPDEIGKLVEPTKALPDANIDEDVLRLIARRKRELIEKECAGLIEFIEPKHGLEAVGGADAIKAELARIAANLREGDRKLTPMGLLAVGPMGSGKTFVLKAFIKDAGLTAVALKNFRSKWVGSTERNLERVLATIKAMGPIALVIDEGDRSFGAAQGGEGGDDGTSSRVIAKLKEFMSDTDNRGVVLFIMLTNRPDKLDSDIKRPGRLDRKIPFFYCENAAERAVVVEAILRRYDSSLAPQRYDLALLCERMEGYSNADLEAMTLLGLELYEQEAGGKEALLAALKRAADDFMPPQERDMIAFMELLAVSEASRRSLLPQRFRNMPVNEIQERLRNAKRAALGR